MKLLSSLIFLISLVLLTACKPGANVVTIENGVEAELTSNNQFLLDYGEKIINGAYVATFTLSNSGKFPITGLSASPLSDKGNLVYTGGTFPGSNGTCGSEIETNQRCTIEFEFRPDHEGEYTYNISLDFNTGISAKQKVILVKGYAGTVASLKFSDSSDMDFGILEVSTHMERIFTLKNTGGLTAKNLSALPLEAPFAYKGGSYPGVGGTCGATLARYSECLVVVELNSTVNENASKSLAIDYFNGNGVTTFSTSVQAMVVSIEADVIFMSSGVQDFSSTILLKGVTKKFKLLNKGYVDATNLVLADTTNFKFENVNCATVLEKSKYCDVNVTFLPTVPGDIQESVSVTYFSGKQNRSVTLTGKGKGINPAIMSFNPLDIVDFGQQGVNSEKKLEFQMKNTGETTATSVSVSVDDPNFTLDSNYCMAIIFKNSSYCSYTVKFNPTSLGVKNGQVKITYNNGQANVELIENITGEATTIAALKYHELDPSTQEYSFAATPVGQHQKVRLLVENVGLSDATKVSGSRSIGNEVNYNEEFSLAGLGRTVNSYPICAGDIEAGSVCRSLDSGTSQYELFYNDGYVAELFDAAATYPSCSTFPQTLCSLNKNIINAGVYAYPGQRVLTDYPICSDTIASHQKCQIVLDHAPTSSQYYLGVYTLNYVSDFLVRVDTADVNLNFISKNLAAIEMQMDNTPLTTDYTFSSVINIGDGTMGILSIYNNGDYDAFINSIELADSTQRNFTFDPTSPSTSEAPGRNNDGETANCFPNTYLRARSSCSVFIWFYPTEHGNTLDDTLTISYYDGVSDTTKNLNLHGVSAGVATVGVSPAAVSLANGKYGTKLNAVAVQLPGNSLSRKVTLVNTGDASMTFTNIKLCDGTLVDTDVPCVNGALSEATFNTSTGTTCQNATVAPASSCTIDILYSPQTIHFSNVFTIGLTYTTAGFTVSKKLYAQMDAAAPSVIEFAGATTPATAYDYQYVEYLETGLNDFTISNTSQLISADAIVYSIVSDASNVFSIDSTNSTCSTTLTNFQTCTVRVKFIPTAIGDFTGTLKITYFNGQKTVSSTQLLKGTGESPRSTHVGWSSIIATGEKLNISGVSDNSIYNEVAWNDMIPKDGYTITGYNIYRRLGDGYYGDGATKNDYTTPLNTSVISTTTKKYKDTAVVAGRVYYYEVRPIVLGFPSRTTQTFSEVRVTTPLSNMVLVHRWMANSMMCKRLGKTPDLNANSRCSYGGIGSKNNYFDVGYDMMVDRYELGVDKSSKPGQMPIKASQANILKACDDQGDQTVTNISKTVSSKTARKRLLSRKEFNLSAMWATTETDATIVAKEQGLASTTKCNADPSGAIKATGSDTLCKSYFGVEDAAGNELEWVSDRMVNGVGLTDQMSVDIGYELRLDTTNKDLDGVDFSTLIPTSAPNLYMKNAPCFTIALALSTPLNGTSGTCLNSKVTSTLTSTYLHDNIYSVGNYNDLKGLASGGAAYLTGTSGVYSSYWLGTGSEIGGRCLLKLDY